MGCEFNFIRLKAKSAAEAKLEAGDLIDRAKWEYGNGGYSGSWAECRSVEFADAPVFSNADEVQDWLDQNAEKWGPMLIVQMGELFYAGANCSS